MAIRLKIGLGVVVLLVGGYAAATWWVNQRTAAVVVEHTAQALGVSTSLEQTSVNLLTGSFRLSGLEGANPQGFDAPHAIVMERGHGRVAFITYLGEVVTLPRVTLGGVELHLERRDGRVNYVPILEHYLREGRHMGDPERRYVVHELLVPDAVVHLDLAPEVGEVARLEVRLGEIRLTGIGEEGVDRGLMLQEVVAVVLRALLTAGLDLAAEEIPSILLRDLTERLEEIASPEF
jgi:hypothetical protein